jgi:hypothetical protein
LKNSACANKASGEFHCPKVMVWQKMRLWLVWYRVFAVKSRSRFERGLVPW